MKLSNTKSCIEHVARNRGDRKGSRFAKQIGLKGLMLEVHTGRPSKDQIDEANLYIGPQVVSAPTEDSDGDILEPTGAKLKQYSRNPVVFWNHGHVDGDLPIGKAETPGGEFDVHVRRNKLWSGVTYDPDNPMAVQIFKMRRNGTIRARSIHFTPFSAKKRKFERAPVGGATHGVHYDDYDLREWSDVGIGANYDAVDGEKFDEEQLDQLKTMKSAGWRLEGEQLVEPLRNAFEQIELPQGNVIVSNAGMPLTVFRRIKSGSGECLQLLNLT